MASIAKRSIIPAIKDLSQKFQLTAIASKSFTKKEKYEGIEDTILYSSYEELISSKEIDCIYIALPNSLHFEWAKKSLESNLHVICEKPLTCSSSETKELVNLAIQNNLVLMETFQFRFHKQFLKIVEIIQSNRLGKLRSLKTSFCFPPFKDKSNIRYQRILGGGSLLDAGCYTIKIAQLILGNKLNVKAATLYQHPESEIDLWGSSFLEEQTDNISAFLTFGFDNYYQCNIEILGQNGKLSADRIFTAPKDYSPSLKLENGGETKILKINPENHFTNMMQYFYKLIKDNKHYKNLEYNQIITQSLLLDKIKLKAKEI